MRLVAYLRYNKIPIPILENFILLLFMGVFFRNIFLHGKMVRSDLLNMKKYNLNVGRKSRISSWVLIRKFLSINSGYTFQFNVLLSMVRIKCVLLVK